MVEVDRRLMNSGTIFKWLIPILAIVLIVQVVLLYRWEKESNNAGNAGIGSSVADQNSYSPPGQPNGPPTGGKSAPPLHPDWPPPTGMPSGPPAGGPATGAPAASGVPATGAPATGAPAGSAPSGGTEGRTVQLDGISLNEAVSVIVAVEQSATPLTATQRTSVVQILTDYIKLQKNEGESLAKVAAMLSPDQANIVAQAPQRHDVLPSKAGVTIQPAERQLPGVSTLIAELTSKAGSSGAQPAQSGTTIATSLDGYNLVNGLLALQKTSSALNAAQARTALDNLTAVKNDEEKCQSLLNSLGSVLSADQIAEGEKSAGGGDNSTARSWLLTEYLRNSK